MKTTPFKIGQVVNTPYGQGEIWKVTNESVHVKHSTGRIDPEYLFSKYLIKTTHHTQNSIDKLSFL